MTRIRSANILEKHVLVTWSHACRLHAYLIKFINALQNDMYPPSSPPIGEAKGGDWCRSQTTGNFLHPPTPLTTSQRGIWKEMTTLVGERPLTTSGLWIFGSSGLWSQLRSGSEHWQLPNPCPLTTSRELTSSRGRHAKRKKKIKRLPASKKKLRQLLVYSSTQLEEGGCASWGNGENAGFLRKIEGHTWK